MIRRAVLALAILLSTLAIPAAASLAAQSQPPPGQSPPGQSEFVPMKDVPPTESIPAAPLLVGGYAFIWVAAIFYLWTIWRRLNKVETEMRALANKTARR